MDFCRTRDFGAVHRILSHPKIYPEIGDDYVPENPWHFKVNEHPDIWYVVVRNGDLRKVGLFSLIPQNRICWEVHVVMMPDASTGEKWAAARQIVPWLEQETEISRLTASVPACNRRAIMYGIHGIGMQVVGRQPKAFRKHGKLQDLILLGTSVGGGPCLV